MMTLVMTITYFSEKKLNKPRNKQNRKKMRAPEFGW